jgi:hypothetical protein
MTMTTSTGFDFAAAPGDGLCAVKDCGAGVTVRATLLRDDYSTEPDEGSYSTEQHEAWERGEWGFWMMQLSVWIGSVCIKENAGCIGGIDCVDDEMRDDDHLNDVADNYFSLDVAGIVREFAEKAAAAAAAVK